MVIVDGEACVDLGDLFGFEPIADQVLLAIVALFLFVLESSAVTVMDFVL